MLELRNVSKSYAKRPVLAALSHRFAAGEFVAIMGESGVGKSTLLNLIAGLDVADSGDVLVDGQPAIGVPVPEVRPLVGSADRQRMGVDNRGSELRFPVLNIAF